MASLVTSCAETEDDFIKKEYAAYKEQHKNDKKDDPTPSPTPTPAPEPKPVPEKYADPQWQNSVVSTSENTMTVFVQLPDSLIGGRKSTDKMAVLCGEQVRGVLTYTSLTNGNAVWMGLIYGDDGEDNLQIRYYASRTQYMYYTEPTYSFVTNGKIGNIDNPKTLSLKVVTVLK